MQMVIQEHGNLKMYEKVYHAIIGEGIENKTMIDLCSCEATFTKTLPFKHKTYVDLVDWGIPVEAGLFVKADVLSEHECFHKHYDVANCSDGIEHLRKHDGLILLEKMKNMSDKQVLFTPLGEYLVQDESNTDPNNHKSGWWPEDFDGFGAIVAPRYHEKLKIGAFWVWRCFDIEQDFARVKALLGF
jgi:hypothetical protein